MGITHTHLSNKLALFSFFSLKRPSMCTHERVYLAIVSMRLQKERQKKRALQSMAIYLDCVTQSVLFTMRTGSTTVAEPLIRAYVRMYDVLNGSHVNV